VLVLDVPGCDLHSRAEAELVADLLEMPLGGAFGDVK
jgi:hypothetical protein